MKNKRPCATDICKNDVIPARDGRYCSKCRQHRYKKNSPFKYYYQKLKCRAKERNKDFSLTLKQFKTLWLREPEKWKHKITSNGNSTWEMDRIKNHEGYHFDNIQIIEKQRNIQKYYDEDRHFHLDINYTPAPQPLFDDECPF